MTADAADGQLAPGPGAGSPCDLSFLRLPHEVQQSIVSHCTQADLICLALVSKHMRTLAAGQLYRNFHIVFPDDDDLSFESPIDGLAGGLDTLTTSDYNYAHHLKDLSMDTLSGGDKGEQSYQSYLYSSSCGKFLNTLLLLTLRRSRCLEAFKWNIRIELSKQVYKELHRMDSLKTVQIRMQAGESYYKPPPPLPFPVNQTVDPPSNWWSPGLPASSHQSGISYAQPESAASALHASHHESNAPSGQDKSANLGPHPKPPPTFSGLKNLRSLRVLEMDELDILDELRVCVRNSSSTLTDLQLSFSDSLAQRTRRANLHLDDSDAEEDFLETSIPSSAPGKLTRLEDERKAQEAALPRILDVEPKLLKKRNMPSISESGPSSAVRPSLEDTRPDSPPNDPKAEFLSSITDVFRRLTLAQTNTGDSATAHEDALEAVTQLAQKYADGGHVPSHVNQKPSQTDTDMPVSVFELPSANKTCGPATIPTLNPDSHLDLDINQHSADLAVTTSSFESLDNTAFLFSTEESHGNSDGIDTNRHSTADNGTDRSNGTSSLREDRCGSSNSSVSASPNQPSGSHGQISLNAKTSEDIFDVLAWQEKIDKLLEEMEKLRAEQEQILAHMNMVETDGSQSANDHLDHHAARAAAFDRKICSLEAEVKGIKDRIAALARTSNSTGAEAPTPAIHEYVRETRGISLKSLGIHQIPVKASVLSRALNLSCLHELTLLNVGSQDGIWSELIHENRKQPLSLRKVFTDHVSSTFLQCMLVLPELHELYMLKHCTKHRPEPDFPQVPVTLKKIRQVLYRHMPTIRRLMIKDDSNASDWDINEKTMVLICKSGLKLEELAISMSIYAVHAFMQYFPSLAHLRALNIIRFRNNDTCIWVMREVLRFIVDNLSHHPEMKLEWIAMENDRVDRIVREQKQLDGKEPDEQGQYRDFQTRPKMAKVRTHLHGRGTILPSIEYDSESNSDEEIDGTGSRLRFKTFGPMQFYDAWNVKIFEKEIREGKL